MSPRFVFASTTEMSAGARLVGPTLASRPHRLQHSGYTYDHHHALDVVGEHVECHLSGHLGSFCDSRLMHRSKQPYSSVNQSNFESVILRRSIA
jgi:hypothetical protein